jgi:hypothetical protein
MPSKPSTRTSLESIPACSHAATGGGDRTRTGDLLVANQLLFQLSYAPEGKRDQPAF